MRVLPLGRLPYKRTQEKSQPLKRLFRIPSAPPAVDAHPMPSLHRPSLPSPTSPCCGRYRVLPLALVLLRPPPLPASPPAACAPPGRPARSALRRRLLPSPALSGLAVRGAAGLRFGGPPFSVAASDAAENQDGEYAGRRVRRIKTIPAAPNVATASARVRRVRQSAALVPSAARPGVAAAAPTASAGGRVRPFGGRSGVEQCGRRRRGGGEYAARRVRRASRVRSPPHTAAGLILGLRVCASTHQTRVASLRAPKPRIRWPGNNRPGEKDGRWQGQ